MNESAPKLDLHEKYLRPSEQTTPSPFVLEEAAKFHGTTLEKVTQIFTRLSELEGRKFDLEIFRKRTGSQIMEDGYYTGCTDFALAFITLARACGVPAKYIETIDVGPSKDYRNSIAGHVYSQIYEKETDSWHWIDPMNRKIDAAPEADSRVVLAEGLDSWDIGIRDFESLSNAVNNFRKLRK